MKTIGLFFLTLGFAAWTIAAAYAGQSVAASQQAVPRIATNAAGNHARETDHAAPARGETHGGKPSDDQQNHRKVSANKAPAASANLSKPKRRNEVSHNRELSGSERSRNSHRPAADKSAGGAQKGLAGSETINHAPSNRPSSAARPAVPSLSNVRHRGPNPPIVGGVRNSNSRNTAALDGTHMNRKRTGN
jgi:hypothetical protein